MGPDVLVIGAGVSGLTTGVRLAEGGADVTIRAAEPPEQTTSAVAGAIWGPVHVGPRDQVLGWAGQTLDVLIGLADQAGTGVRLVTGMELTRTPLELPFWAGLVPSMRVLGTGDVPPGFTAGWRYTSPLVDMPEYLGYLLRRFTDAGGTLELSPVTSLAGAPVVVNCTGVAARDLVPDPAVYPMRGQVVIAENPGIEEFLISRDEPPPGTAYMFPHGDRIVVGGSTETGADELRPDPETARRILENASRLEPRLRDAAVLGHRVGLRPCRPAVRLEAETRGGTLIWHNYGHGGAGISVSWGCAAEVAAGVLGLPLSDFPAVRLTGWPAVRLLADD